ncbi:MAG TPA: bifunctional enoyl-CoA hydratase/phosphate acetyltransferase [Rubrivivax sp.]|nr:bifunctional enoyl-CoA hydratase/phosphate acetyltransferase [Rubrivivax sp.]
MNPTSSSSAAALAPLSPAGTHPRLARLVEAARARAASQPPPLGLVHPCDALALDAARRVAAAGIARPVLVGARELVARAADEAAVAIDDFELVDTGPGGAQAAARAVALARAGALAALMKGSLHTDELMSAVVHRDHGLRGTRRVSHAFLFDLPRYHKLIALADCVVNIAPHLPAKRDILANALDLLRGLGLEQPKVGVVCAVETVNPAIAATQDAKALADMAARGEFGRAVVEGPLGFDNAYSAEAARIKRIDSDVAGDADLLLVPDLNAGNMLYKSFNYVGGGDAAGLVLGTRVPIVLTSRADTLQARVASAALAMLQSSSLRG